MQLTAEQELRKEFLLFSLSKQPDIEAAIEMAAQMERFVLNGRQERNGKDHEAAPATEGSHSPACQRGAMADIEVPAIKQQVISAGPLRKRRWSEADDRSLKRLWCSDSSLEEIANELNRTVPSLYSRAHALGMEKRNPKPHERPHSQAIPSQSTREKSGDGIGTGTTGDKAQQTKAHVAQTSPTKVSPESTAPDWTRARGVGDGHRSPVGRNGSPRKKSPPAPVPGRPAPASATLPGTHSEIYIEPIVQFLRSRDYSVVRVGEGQFRLDGRRTLNVDELRQKANQVKKSLGQEPFGSRLGEAVG